MGSNWERKVNYLFVTGMFRSGTTLLGKILNAHPEISLASDPYRPFFNDFRDSLAEAGGLSTPEERQAPLGSYFCDGHGLEIMRAIQASDLNLSLSSERLRDLIPMMSARTVSFSPLIAQRMCELEGRTYRELYESMMRLIGDCYGKKGARFTGMKEVWCTEFIRPLLKTFPQAKCITILRDPRAVFASKFVKNGGGEKYPWLFLIRQWRKLAVFAWLHATDPDMKNSVLVLRYEDLVSDPEVTAQKICVFLGISYLSEMVDGSRFRDGRGEEWRQNSSHGTGAVISKVFAEKWRDVLSREEVSLIEKSCSLEMKLFGYELSGSDCLSGKDIWNPLIIPEEELAKWIRKYSDFRRMTHVREMWQEYFRRRLLGLSPSELEKLEPRVIEAFYLSPRYFDHLRNKGKSFFSPLEKAAVSPSVA
jgi:hypothetical protein